MNEHNDIKVICGALVVDGDSLVIVQEAKEHCRGKWNLPAGHAHSNEDLLTAAVREVKEETNLDIKLDGLVGIYQHLSSSGVNYVKFIFKGTPISGNLKFPENEILDAKWITFDEFLSMPLTELRIEELRTMVMDYMNRGVWDLGIIRP